MVLRASRWVVTLAAAALVVGACGEDEEGTPTGSSTTGTGGTAGSGAAGGEAGSVSGGDGGTGGTAGTAGAGGESAPGYGECPDCADGEECNAFFIGSVCAAKPCRDATECPAPPGGDAQPACFDWGSGAFCGLDCSSGAECPTGMDCFLDMWCTFTVKAAGGGTCPDAVLGNTVPQTFAGSTVGVVDDVVAILGDNPLDEALLEFTAPSSMLFSIDVTSSAFEPYLLVLDACDGTVVGESSFAKGGGVAHMLLSLDAGQTVIIGVEGVGAAGDYSLAITEAGPQIGGSECCSAQATPGCAVAAVAACVCTDPFCCDTHWDGVCAHRATECGADCL